MSQPKRFIVGRQQEVQHFADLMAGRIPHQVLNIYGPGGIGKTVVGERLTAYAQEEGLALAMVDGNHPALTPDRMLFLFSEALVQSQAGEPLESALRDFDRFFREYLTVNQVLQEGGGVQTLFDLVGNVKDPAGFASILSTLGSGVTESVKRTVSNRFALERYLRGADRILTTAFFEGLQAGMEETGQTIALVLDTYEAMEGLDDWVCRTFVAALPDQARLIILGRNQLHKINFDWAEYDEKVQSLDLPELGETDAKAYLHHFGLTDTVALDQVYRYTGGYPLLLVLVRHLAREAGGWQAIGALESGADRDRIATKLLERILREEHVKDVQAFLEKGVVARWFDPETVRVILQVDLDAARKIYDRLALHSFVERHPYGLKFHDKIRELLLDRLKFSSPSEYARLNQRLMDYYAEKAGIHQPAESSKGGPPTQSQTASKYSINIYGPSQGLVIGDSAQVDQRFGDETKGSPGASS
ncbi:MAG: ATP-binding protein [Caldilineaceae bacterium]|nr:ATP-binding protein [Caldilineaceae bacterium]